MDNKVEKKLLVIRNIIRETLLGNAIILLAVYILSKSLPPQNIPDYGIIILTSVTMTGAITWLFWITTIYIKKIFKIDEKRILRDDEFVYNKTVQILKDKDIISSFELELK